MKAKLIEYFVVISLLPVALWRMVLEVFWFLDFRYSLTAFERLHIPSVSTHCVTIDSN